MRTTLIYAGIVGQGFGSAGKGMDSGWISHALCLLGACAKKDGFEIDLIDLRALRDWDHFRSEIVSRRPDVVGLTMMSVDYNPVMHCVDIVKEELPQTLTVVGGPHPTLAMSEVAANPKVDHIVTHEGEIAFVDLLHKFAAGQSAERVVQGQKADLDALPFGDRDLFLNEWRKAGYNLESPEIPMGNLPAPFVTVIAGRGCMYNCSFCQPAERVLFGGQVRRRSVNSIIAELRYLREKYRFKSLLIHDDCLTEDREWVLQFCHSYKANGFTQPFFCQSRADIIVKNQDMVRAMRDVGLSGMLIGFESGNQRILKFLRKGTTVEQNILAGRICHDLGIQIWANYMLGLPTETQEEAMDTVRMLKKIDPDYYSPAFYTPHPGSDLYNYCVENDLSLITDHDSYRRNPTEVKIKGHDYAFLQRVLKESQERTLPNKLKRSTRSVIGRYASPSKVARKARQTLLAREEK